MVSHNTYQSEFDRSPTYMTGISYQNQFYQRQSYQNQPSYANQSGIDRAYYRGNPQMNYTACGAAFTALPADLGGKTSGDRTICPKRRANQFNYYKRKCRCNTNQLAHCRSHKMICRRKH